LLSANPVVFPMIGIWRFKFDHGDCPVVRNVCGTPSLLMRREKAVDLRTFSMHEH